MLASSKPCSAFASFPIAAAMAVGLLTQSYAQSGPQLDVRFVPTPQEVVDRMLEMAKVESNDLLIDLGSGDGRIPVTAAKKYGVRAIGVDLDPDRINEARANAKEAGVTDKVTFHQQNLFDTKIDEASVVTMYLLQSINMKLRPKLHEVLKPGTRIVSHAFDMGDWEPDQRASVNGRQIYMWVIPAKVEGRWHVQRGERQFTIDLKQHYQRVSGTATIDGKSVPITNAHVNGRMIEFSLPLGDQTVLRGEISGDSIQGSAGSNNWTAKRA